MQAISAFSGAVMGSGSQPLKVVAFGDSLVYGFGDPIGGGWVERLRRQWMAEEGGPVLYNLGVRGDRVANLARRFEQEYRCRGELRNRLPDAAILSVGVNDSPRLGRPDGKPATELLGFQRQVEALLDRVHRSCPVLFVGMVPVEESRMPFLDCFYYSHLDQYHYKETIKRACQVRQIPYLDIFDLWLSRGTHWLRSVLSPDGLHPNTAGYETLLQDVLNWEAMQLLSPPNSVFNPVF